MGNRSQAHVYLRNNEQPVNNKFLTGYNLPDMNFNHTIYSMMWLQNHILKMFYICVRLH